MYANSNFKFEYMQFWLALADPLASISFLFVAADFNADFENLVADSVNFFVNLFADLY